MTLAERVHQFLQRSCPLDLEEDFVVVVGNLYIKVLADCLGFWLLNCGASVVIRHFGLRMSDSRL